MNGPRMNMLLSRKAGATAHAPAASSPSKRRPEPAPPVAVKAQASPINPPAPLAKPPAG